MMRFLCSFLAILTFVIAQQNAAAQEGPDEFYRPIQSRDLVTKLPPRVGVSKSFSGSESDFLSFQGDGCPETILIGSVDEDSDVFGGVDIDVVVESDIIIQCGGL